MKIAFSLPSMTTSSRRQCVLQRTMSIDTGSTAIIWISSFPSVYVSYTIFSNISTFSLILTGFWYILPYLLHVAAYCLLVVIFIWGIPWTFPIRLLSISNDMTSCGYSPPE